MTEREARLEQELEDAANVLQTVLPIGRVKHIGLLEVAAGVKLLADTIQRANDAMGLHPYTDTDAVPARAR